jgi:hypothetical protein
MCVCPLHNVEYAPQRLGQVPVGLFGEELLQHADLESASNPPGEILRSSVSGAIPEERHMQQRNDDRVRTELTHHQTNTGYVHFEQLDGQRSKVVLELDQRVLLFVGSNRGKVRVGACVQ